MPKSEAADRTNRVLIAEDQLIAEGLRKLLECEFESIMIVGNEHELFATAANSRPDVVLLDIHTQAERHRSHAALQQDFTSDTGCNPTAKESAQRRTVELTVRQREVLRLIAKGCTAKEIANALNLSAKTAVFHRMAIMDKLGLRTTAELTSTLSTTALSLEHRSRPLPLQPRRRPRWTAAL